MTLPRGSVLSLALLALVAGCVTPDALSGASVETLPGIPSDAPFAMDGRWSKTLVPGTLQMLPVEVVDVPSFDGTKLNIGIFRPDVPEGTRVPVIMDAGPYYDDGDEKVGSNDTHRLGGFLIENFVPHGYAVVQASIRGTGQSGACVDYMGDKEQADLDALVTWLGEQPWSNGNVAMIGRSYDGSTPWEAATFGNPHLKTIVPISGITDLQQLHYRNGTAEARSLILGSLYYSYGAGEILGSGDIPYRAEDDPRAYARMACAEGPQHAPMGAAGYLTGGGQTGTPGPVDRYWETRSFTGRVLENYQGSIYYIHGLQDWNVWPSQGTDVYNAFQGEKKALLGQWGHNYPDRPDEHEMLRWDWAEVLLRWFDSELKGIPTDTGPAVEVMDHRGHWQALEENAWPPQDAAWIGLHPSADGSLVAQGSDGAAELFAPTPIVLADLLRLPVPETPLGKPALRWETAAFEEGVHLSGMPRFHVTVEPRTPGGILYAELYEHNASDEYAFVGRAQMDLRFAEGGKAMKPIVPGQPLVAKMEFYPLDARIEPGSSLVLVLTQGELTQPLPNPATGPVVVMMGDDLTTLELPTVERAWVDSRWDVEDGQVLDENA